MNEIETSINLSKKMSDSPTIGDQLNGRNNNFDIIRFVAATLVVYYHSFPLAAGNNKGDIVSSLADGRWNTGALAVSTFFIVSGFLITQSFTYQKNLLTFFWARFLRIFPGLFIALLVTTFFLGPLVTSYSLKDYFSSSSTYQYLKSLFLFPLYWELPGVFENNVYKNSVNGSLWTIPFEVICYLIVAILGILKLLNSKKFIILFFFLNLYFVYYGRSVSPSGWGHFWGLEISQIQELFTYFLAGMAFFVLRDYIKIDRHFAMISIVILSLSIYYGGIKELYIIFGSYLIIYFALSNSFFYHFSKYGDYSYGLYIYAFPIQQTVTHFFGGKMPPFLNFFLSLILTLIVAIFSWHLIEKQALRYKAYKFNFIDMYVKGVRLKGINILEKVVCRNKKPLSWKSFVIIFSISCCLFTIYNSKPSVVTFPYEKSNSIFSEGWLPQSRDEKYRWVAKKASIQMKKTQNAKKLIVQGFIPESFVEVNNVNLYINNRLIIGQSIQRGKELLITCDTLESIPENNLFITLEFNDVHKPASDSAEKRELSALISKIIIE